MFHAARPFLNEMQEIARAGRILRQQQAQQREDQYLQQQRERRRFREQVHDETIEYLVQSVGGADAFKNVTKFLEPDWELYMKLD